MYLNKALLTVLNDFHDFKLYLNSFFNSFIAFMAKFI